jgi:hypothetical protein
MLTTLVNSCSCDASLETGRDNFVRFFEDAFRQIDSLVQRVQRDNPLCGTSCRLTLRSRSGRGVRKDEDVSYGTDIGRRPDR